MIPQQLTLKNFLSYREATLDFRGLHVAGICGPNGAGKSSLLEAIAWAVWGQSRAASEDDIIHVGTREAQVDFVFTSHQQTYRIIRTRHRGQASSLEFQVSTANGFRSLTARGLRATQQTIRAHLNLDYDTFVNSAYLRQGRADEFMLKRPGDRKQLLSELLKLNHYDLLSERAKDLSRQFKGQVALLEKSLAALEKQLQQEAVLIVERATVEAKLAEMQALQQADSEQHQRRQAAQQQRQVWQQHLQWQQQQQQNLTQDLQHLQDRWTLAQQQQQGLEMLLQQAQQITAEYSRYQHLQSQEESLTAKFQTFQAMQEQRQTLQQQQQAQKQQLLTQLQQVEAQRATWQQQEEELQQILSKAASVEAALEKLRAARTQLTHLDQLQTQVFPLLQRQQQLQIQLEHQTSRLSARLEELHHQAQQLQTQQSRQPRIQQAVLSVSEEIEHLEKKRIYQQHVQEKGLERRSFMERLQAQQRDCEIRLGQLEQKIEFLGQPDAACPLCDRPLDHLHWELVQKKHQVQKQDILDQIWVVREQLSVSEREIQVLRQEYRRLDQELTEYHLALERRGQLQEQLQTTQSLSGTLQQIKAEVDAIERSLVKGDYAMTLQTELHQLAETLSKMHYDEKDHALARGQVEHWRWAEIKQVEVKQAQRRQAQIAARLPELETEMATLQQRLQQLDQSQLQQQINQLERQLVEINYDFDHHNTLRATLQQTQWQLRYQALRQAQQQYPQVQQQVRELAQTHQQRSQDLAAISRQITVLQDQLAHAPNDSDVLQALEQKIQQRRSDLDDKLAQLGRLQQQQQQLDSFKFQFQEQQQQLQAARCQYQVYQELAQAFGKNGIQALMIENILPQLEAQTNQLLARLSGSQLHVQFVTQRAGRGSKAHSQLIDTLDILIADAQGTRPYETYSGGEAFRVNFAIRLALARLLAQRTGSDLQMLIIDEGFGTQDTEGCERLIAAINAIATDFACILTVTHVPTLKEAFQTRIEVTKTPTGSRLSLSV